MSTQPARVDVRLSARLGLWQMPGPDQHTKPTRKGGRFETEQAKGLRIGTLWD